jgi:predicted DNA binding CopG/RHH family protein
MHRRSEFENMKKRLPRLSSKKAAEDFVATADLTRYDLSAMVPMRFELKPKTHRAKRPSRKSNSAMARSR